MGATVLSTNYVSEDLAPRGRKPPRVLGSSVLCFQEGPGTTGAHHQGGRAGGSLQQPSLCGYRLRGRGQNETH